MTIKSKCDCPIDICRHLVNCRKYARHGDRVFPQYARDGETAMATEGLSTRDYFAGQVLAGMAARATLSVAPLEQLAARAYAEADAMLRARQS